MKKKDIYPFSAYQLYAAYHYKFYDPHMSLPHDYGGRPHIAIIVDLDDDFAWVIPMSSREKNGSIHKKNYLEKRANSDMVSVLEVDGVSDYYHIENSIPVPFEYFSAPFIRKGKQLRIENLKDQKELSRKLENIKRLKYKGLLTKGKMDTKLVDEMVQDYMNGYRYPEEDIQIHEGMTVENKLQQEIRRKEELIEEKDNLTSKKEKVQIYVYTGIEKPKKVESIEDITVENDVLGDVTKELKKDYNYRMQGASLEELQEYQFFAEYGLWVNPTRLQLEEYNDFIGLNRDENLHSFEGHKQLFEDRNVSNDTIIRLDDDFER